MIKALINIMGMKPGDTVLDPMIGLWHSAH